jgi:hypothetical protein
MKRNIFPALAAAAVVTAISLSLAGNTSLAEAAENQCQVLENNAWYKCDESNDIICSAMYYNGHLTVCHGNKVPKGTDIQ